MESLIDRPPRADILGCPLDRVDLSGAVEVCRDSINRSSYVQHMAINAAKLVALQDDAALASVIRDCGLITADGQAVVWASRVLGDPLPTRVAGIDLMLELMRASADNGYRVFILGARAEVLETACGRLTSRFPTLQIAGTHHGYFGPAEEDDIAATIRAADPDILFVAMGSPRKELFLGRYGRGLGVPFVMGVGGSVDVIAGKTRRAPRVMQQAGLEWLFRLIQEPRRLLRRYATTNTRFLLLVGREAMRRWTSSAGDRPSLDQGG